MTAYFVDGTNGSNSNDGLAASLGGGHGPYLTLAKAIGASGAPVGGDTVYVAPKAGGYRELITLGVTPASELKVIGDVRRSQAWAASTPNGPVIISAWTTNDYTVGSSSALIVSNGKNFMTFEDIWFMGMGNPNTLDLITTPGSTNWTFRRCAIWARVLDAVFGLAYKCAVGVDPNLMFDRCIWFGGSTLCSVDAPLHTTNYAVTVTHKNNMFYCVNSARGIEINSTGAGVGKPQGPWMIEHCTFNGAFNPGGIDPRNANWATGSVKTYANLAIGCPLQSGNNSTTFTSDFNRIIGGANIGASPVGQNDVPGSTQALLAPYLIEMGQSELWGFVPKPWFSFWPGDPINSGIGEGAGVTEAVDLYGRPRPAGAFVPGFEAATVVTGTATSGATTQLTKTGAGWTVNQFVGYILTITGGTGSGQRRWVASNTATVLTPAYNFITAPDNTSTFSLDPPGMLKQAGCFEAYDAYLPGGAANADGASGNCLEIIGPGNVRIRRAVPASATIITVKVKWDSVHGDADKPRAIMLWQPAIGVDDAADTTLKYHEIVTATGTAGSGYETLTFSSITPTAAGWVDILLQSRAALGPGIAYFDTVGP